ncbi:MULTISPECIES: IS982 family transposase [unclassified Photorhabdus]|uniref:IS982 family transposase n=2 Tax=Photorhabdus TaxID=29487 RepID=UPI000DCD65E5|nr:MULTISPECIES: IS982 family transposase [unclassified Photorhabdus]RAW90839.1 IS982 family transposase [Photorhabdus sp. S9-53]RAW94605.1 IS982 family transposase [Photorhabdus sp. S8-52]RAW95547.1 IS982 family transposase [Photorhabdus sp. S10-54]
MTTLEELYCCVDDFCQKFMPMWEQQLIANNQLKRHRATSLSLSEVITILILFHMSHYRHFKGFYTEYVQPFLTAEFPGLVSYNRIITLKKRAIIPLCAFLSSRKVKSQGIAFIDSTKIAVCHNARIPRNQVFDGVAKRGKTSTGWFYGFKLHLIITDCGEIVSVKLTPGNTDDREPVKELVKELSGHLYGDKGYLSQALCDELKEEGITLITNVRRNMKAKFLSLWDKVMLRKRFLIETVNDQLKNISQIEHSRHRSIVGFLLEVVSGLIAYTFQPKKPSLGLRAQEIAMLKQS